MDYQRQRADSRLASEVRHDFRDLVLNNCTSGLVNPKQKLCLQSRCSGTVATHDGDIVHHHGVPSHGERVYGLIRHPVTRFISFLRYRLVGKGCRGDFARAGLCKHKTNVSHLVDSMTDADMLAFLPFRTLTAYVGAANKQQQHSPVHFRGLHAAGSAILQLHTLPVRLS